MIPRGKYSIRAGKHSDHVSWHRKLSTAVAAMKRFLRKRARKTDTVEVGTDKVRLYHGDIVRFGVVVDRDGHERRPAHRYSAVIVRWDDV